MKTDPTYIAQRPAFLHALRAANVVRCPDFQTGDLHEWSPAERGNEMAGEVGELCNELKKLLRHCKRYGVDHEYAVRDMRNAERMGKIESEVGDVLICLDLICAQLGIDIEKVTRAKFNATSAKIGSVVRL